MKLFTKLAQASTALVMLSSVVLGTAHVSAAGPGQIAQGNQNYKIANITKGTDFANPQSADACDELQYRLRLYNPGPSPLADVKVEASINTMTKYSSAVSTATVYAADGKPNTIADQATLNISTPQTQSYVAGSTKLLDSAGNVIKSSAAGTLADTVTMGGGGISLGGISDSVTEYLVFNTKLSCPPVTPPKTPIYTCDMFDINADKDRTVKITDFSTTAKDGATFKNAVVSWGDNSDDFTSATLIGKSHQYAKDGTYTITATAHFTVNNQDVTAPASVNCSKNVTFKGDTPPTVTPPTTPPTTPASPAKPTTLVNTGAGSVIGLFAAATAVGAAAYRKVLSRRLSEV